IQANRTGCAQCPLRGAQIAQAKASPSLGARPLGAAGIARITCQHLLLDCTDEGAVEDAMDVPTSTWGWRTHSAVAATSCCPLSVGGLNVSGSQLGDRQCPELGHQKIVHDFGIALVGLRTDLFPYCGKPNCEPSPNSRTSRIDMLTGVE